MKPDRIRWRRPQGITEQDWHVIRCCVEMIVEENFIVDAAFHPRLGLDRDKARQHIIDGTGLSVEEEIRLIGGSLVETFAGIRITPEEWDERFTFTREHVRFIFDKWREIHPRRR